MRCLLQIYIPKIRVTRETTWVKPNKYLMHPSVSEIEKKLYNSTSTLSQVDQSNISQNNGIEKSTVVDQDVKSKWVMAFDESMQQFYWYNRYKRKRLSLRF